MSVIQLALNAFDCIRYAILYHLAESDKKLKGKIEADEATILEEKEREIVAEVPRTRPSYLAYWKEREKFTLRL